MLLRSHHDRTQVIMKLRLSIILITLAVALLIDSLADVIPLSRIKDCPSTGSEIDIASNAKGKSNAFDEQRTWFIWTISAHQVESPCQYAWDNRVKNNGKMGLSKWLDTCSSWRRIVEETMPDSKSEMYILPITYQHFHTPTHTAILEALNIEQ